MAMRKPLSRSPCLPFDIHFAGMMNMTLRITESLGCEQASKIAHFLFFVL